jgi:hypothetical protein
MHHWCPSSLSVDNTPATPTSLTGFLSAFCRRRWVGGRVDRAAVRSDMMSGIVDGPATSNIDLCSPPSASEPESEDDELPSSLEDESSDSEFSLEEADEDEALFA